jgi:hypothetical protein
VTELGTTDFDLKFKLVRLRFVLLLDFCDLVFEFALLVAGRAFEVRGDDWDFFLNGR